MTGLGPFSSSGFKNQVCRVASNLAQNGRFRNWIMRFWQTLVLISELLNEQTSFGERLYQKQPPPQEEATFSSSSAALFPTTSTTMQVSSTYSKDSQMVEAVEVEGTPTGDEAELARMGYKQELKCVQFSLSILPCLLKFMTLINYQA